jgi:hypothetical protein
MRVYHQDLSSLKVGGPCIIMEEVIAAGTNPAGPVVRFYFGTVKDLPEGEPVKYQRNRFGDWLSDAYADLSSPVGIDGYDFTEIQGWGGRSGYSLSGEVWMLPDSPETRYLIHMGLHQENNAHHWRNVSAGRLTLFTDILTQMIKGLTSGVVNLDTLKQYVEKILGKSA